MTAAPRLKAAIWVQALVRRYDALAVPVMVAAKGDPDAGAVIVRLVEADDRVTVLTQSRTTEGELVWRPAPGSPMALAAADQRVARERDIDADVWVIDIEDPQGRLLLPERVLGA